MEKTRAGLPVCIAAAGVYLLACFGGYTAALLLLGFMLLWENNGQLKVAAVTAVAMLVAYSLASLLVNLIPSLLELYRSFMWMFNEYESVDSYRITRFTSFLNEALTIAKSVVFVVLAAMAAVDKPLELKIVKKWFD